MQEQNKLRSRLGPLVFLGLLLVLGLVASLQQFRLPLATQEPTPKKPAFPALSEGAISPFMVPIRSDLGKSLTSSPNEDANTARLSFDGVRFFMRSPRTGVELAEAHNLFQMRSYEARVTRQLKSRTPILPVSLVPNLEETVFDGWSR